MQWLEDPEARPILRPDKLFGPDIVFVLQLDDMSHILAVIQSKRTAPAPGKDAIRTITPEFFYRQNVSNQFSCWFGLG